MNPLMNGLVNGSIVLPTVTGGGPQEEGREFAQSIAVN